MGDFDGKVALVSGGSRGIGRACTLELARRGASVTFTFSSNEAAARSVEAESGGKAHAVALDVCDAKACAAVVDGLASSAGRLDVLVANAGIARDGLVMRLSDDDWHRQFQVNVDGVFHLVRAAARPMMKQRSGAIVTVASVVGEMGNAGQSGYAATKAALVGFTKSVARELASRNVRANLVSPGFIETDMTARIAGEAREQLIASVPLGRMGTADEVARAVAFLVGDGASYVTGELLRVNGGLLT